MSKQASTYEVCYFCHETTDAVLEKHHVVPSEVVTCEKDANSELTDETVTLCANCHRKTHELLKPLVEFYANKLRRRENFSGFKNGVGVEQE